MGGEEGRSLACSTALADDAPHAAACGASCKARPHPPPITQRTQRLSFTATISRYSSKAVATRSDPLSKSSSVRRRRERKATSGSTWGAAGGGGLHTVGTQWGGALSGRRNAGKRGGWGGSALGAGAHLLLHQRLAPHRRQRVVLDAAGRQRGGELVGAGVMAL